MVRERERSMCIFNSDPFDPIHGWTPISLIDGIPTFDESGFTPLVGPIMDENGQERGLFRLDCQYRGFYW